MNNQLDEARKYAEKASELIKPFGTNLYHHQLLLAAMAWVKGDYKEAKAMYMDIQTRLGLLGEKNTRAGAIGLLGSVALEESDFGQAHLFLGESLGIAREIQNYYFVVMRLIEIGNLHSLEGHVDEFRRKYQEALTLAKRLTVVEKFDCLFFMLRPLDRWTVHHTVSILGALHHYQRETEILADPILKRFYDRAEAHARQILSKEEFETAFAEGQKLSLDETIDLVLKMVEEM